MNNKTKIYKIYSLFIKILIIVFAFWFIYRRLFIKEKFDNTLSSFKHLFDTPSFIITLSIVFLLMFLNWGLETAKWKYLINKIENVKFAKAFVAVFSGITVSIFTPNRIGEYAGRVFILEKADRWAGVIITIIASMSQLLITLVIGSVCFIFFAYNYLNLSENPVYYFLGIILLVIIFDIVLIFLFYNVSFLSKLLERLPFKLRKIKPYGKVFSLYSFKELSLAILLSLSRYIVFFTQYYILLRLFGVCIPLFDALVLISLIFLVMTVIPTISLFEIGIRVPVAVYFISLYFEQQGIPARSYDIGVIAASSLLWVINLVIPSLLGAVFVFQLKFFRKN